MLRKFSGVTAGVIATVAGVVFANPAVASDPGGGGSWDHTWVSLDGGVTLHVQEHGDIVDLCDTRADGLSVRVEVSWDGGSYYFYNYGGNGTCEAVSASTAAKYDLPEGKKIYIWISASNNIDNLATSYVNDH